MANQMLWFYPEVTHVTSTRIVLAKASHIPTFKALGKYRPTTCLRGEQKYLLDCTNQNQAFCGRQNNDPSCSGPNSWIMLCYGAKRNGVADEVKVVHQLTLK